MYVCNNTYHNNIFQISVLLFISICSTATIASSLSETVVSSTTSSPSSTPSSSTKVKRQYVYQRPSNGLYLPPYDASRREADANAQIISQVDQKDSNGNYNYG